MPAPFLTRFAPSPSGRLHLGHALSAVLVRRAGDQAGGAALLRIEDIDTVRCKPEFEAAIFEDLDWLGLSWDGAVRRQSDHFADYRAALNQLVDAGLAYGDARTREDVAAWRAERGGAPYQPGPAERHAPEGAALAWRLSLSGVAGHVGEDALNFEVETDSGRTRQRADWQSQDDPILWRRDDLPAYILAACHDDALQHITHIIRGEDLIEAPHTHRLLQAAMGWPSPILRHHRLLYGPDGRKLSKSHGSKTIASLRAEGLSADEVLKLAGLS